VPKTAAPSHDARSPLGRSVRLRSSLFSKPPHSPSLRSVAAPRGTRLGIWTAARLAFRGRVRRWLIPGQRGLRHAATIHVAACSGPHFQAGAKSWRKLRRHPASASLSQVHNRSYAWSPSSRGRVTGNPARNEKGTVRWPRKASVSLRGIGWVTERKTTPVPIDWSRRPKSGG